MRTIGIVSDSHGFLHPTIKKHLLACDEIWHAGDIGNADTLKEFQDIKPLRAVYGNIDGQDIRIQCKQHQIFIVEGIKVLMIHIGGYPGRYWPDARKLIQQEKPKLFISGHSHILKVIPDKKYDLLHINPGSCGKSGIHQKITMLKLKIDQGNFVDLQIIEMDRDS
jgi:uncharacterized protein